MYQPSYVPGHLCISEMDRLAFHRSLQLLGDLRRAIYAKRELACCEANCGHVQTTSRIINEMAASIYEMQFVDDSLSLFGLRSDLKENMSKISRCLEFLSGPS